MKQILIGLFLICVFASCNNSENKPKVDNLTSLETSIKVDSMVKAKMKEVKMADTVGVSDCGLVVTSAKLVKGDYDKYVRLTYKNVSGKDISAIRFKWYVENAFGEPSNIGILGDGFGAGYDDTGLKKGKTVSNQWSLSGEDAKKIVNAWPYEIVFEDGTKWKSESK